MVQKRGQITHFILIGIIIVFLAGILFFVYHDQQAGLLKHQVTVVQKSQFLDDPVENFVHSCIREAAETSVHVVSLQGGYFSVPEPSMADYDLKIPFYAVGIMPYLPGEERVESELADMFNNEFLFCIKSFKDFTDMGYKFYRKGDISTVVDIEEDMVIFRMDYPVVIYNPTSEIEISDFEYTLDSDIWILYYVASRYAMHFAENDQSVCLSCMTLFSEMYGVRTSMYDSYDNVTVFEVFQKDDPTGIFSFALRE
ncbi:hypothetical protein JW968_05055 [Candidatus Woesearchaeota archaeon]|nr:hypothetical protein [Candidatus Woesearchaeota archaeon]